MKKKKRRLGRKLIGVISLTVAIVAIMIVAKDLIEYNNLVKQKELVESELSLLTEENQYLSEMKSKLEDENYVQTYARGEYMFSKEDEKVFYLPSNGN